MKNLIAISQQDIEARKGDPGKNKNVRIGRKQQLTESETYILMNFISTS